MAAKSKRPPKTWIRRCIRGVTEGARRAGRKLRSAGAVCGNTWYHVMTAADRRRAKRKYVN